MKMSVSETAALMNISVRTLHYYDEIGLLKPSDVSEAGYRSYDENAIAILQQIMFFRELEFPLGEIKQMLSRPDYDRDYALQCHRDLLNEKKKHIESLLRLVDETLGGKMTMNNENGKNQSSYEKMREKYADETRKRYGKTAEYAESEKKAGKRTAEENEAFIKEQNEIFRAFSELLGANPADEAVQKLVEEWKAFITKHYYKCTNEILAGLGQMYVGDERFTENLDVFGKGTAKLMSDAIAVYCGK